MTREIIRWPKYPDARKREYRNDPTPRKIDRWLVFQTLYKYIYIYHQIEQQESTKTNEEDQTDTYIYYKIELYDFFKPKGEIRRTYMNNMTPLKQRGKIRRTHIYTKGEIRRTHIYTIRLNNMTPLHPRRKIRWTHIYTKGENQTDTYIYIYHKIEQHDSTKTEGEDQTGTYKY
jgi:hypothetical protein